MPGSAYSAGGRGALEGSARIHQGLRLSGASRTEGIKTFLLVRDQGDCCFGGNPKITDRIQVTLVDPLRLTFHKGRHNLAGVFQVKPARSPDGIGGIYYQLEADYLR